MAEIAFENDRFSNFEGLVTVTLDRVILHTVVHHSSTSTHIPNFIEIEETFVDDLPSEQCKRFTPGFDPRQEILIDCPVYCEDDVTLFTS